MKKHIIYRIVFLGMILLMFSGCLQPIDDSKNSGSGDEQGKEAEDDDDETDEPKVTVPELTGLTVNSMEPTIGLPITATAVYKPKDGTVNWQWTADNVPIEGANTAAYTPGINDFDKILGINAAPTGTTTGESKTYTFSAKVKAATDTPPPAATSYSVTGLFKTSGGKHYIKASSTGSTTTGPNIYNIPAETYTILKPIFDKNKDNGALQFFEIPFAAGGQLDINYTLSEPAKKIRLKIDSSLTGTRDNPLTVTVPLIASNNTKNNTEDIDQLLYYKTPVYLVNSNSGTGPDAKYVTILVENRGYLYIPATGGTPQTFKGVIRVQAGGILVDAGGAAGGYSAGADALYWFEYGSYGWVQTPTFGRAPFIATNEPYLFEKTDIPGVVWVPGKEDSFVWVGNNTFLLQGTIKQVRTFSLSAHLLLTPGSEYIIDIDIGEANKLLLLDGKNIAKWLPNPSEDYYNDLTLGGAITPEPKIHIAAGSAIRDYALPPGQPDTAFKVGYICTADADLSSPPETVWEWDPGANTSGTPSKIPVGNNKEITGGWKKILSVAPSP
jgi:hypothetical protein